MSFKQYLQEGRDAPLYHGTALDTANDVLKSNVLKAFTIAKGLPRNKDLGISTSRSLSTAMRIGVRKKDLGIVFQLNQRKLNQKYKIVPYNHFNFQGPQGAKARELGIEQYNEYEEFILGSVKNVKSYIDRVIIVIDNESYIFRDPGRYKEIISYPNLWAIDAHGKLVKEYSKEDKKKLVVKYNDV